MQLCVISLLGSAAEYIDCREEVEIVMVSEICYFYIVELEKGARSEETRPSGSCTKA